jgi:hypothetical protein
MIIHSLELNFSSYFVNIFKKSDFDWGGIDNWGGGNIGVAGGGGGGGGGDDRPVSMLKNALKHKHKESNSLFSLRLCFMLRPSLSFYLNYTGIQGNLENVQPHSKEIVHILGNKIEVTRFIKIKHSKQTCSIFHDFAQ